jgi:hypothetical protein
MVRSFNKKISTIHIYGIAGPIMSLNQGILSERLVIINSFEVAKTLMNGRSENYSARPFAAQREYVFTDLVCVKLF